MYPFLVWAATSRLDAPDQQEGRTDSPAEIPVDADDPDQLWRRLCAVEYTIYVRERGNDGPPESELPTSNQQAEATATAERLSAIVQFPAGTLRARAAGAAFAHGQDPGTDDDPDRYAPPSWPEGPRIGLAGVVRRPNMRRRRPRGPGVASSPHGSSVVSGGPERGSRPDTAMSATTLDAINDWLVAAVYVAASVAAALLVVVVVVGGGMLAKAKAKAKAKARARARGRAQTESARALGKRASSFAQLSGLWS